MSDYKKLTMEGSILGKIVNCVVCPNKTKNYTCRKDKTNCLQAVINRLAELEDKIENGTLIELPCKVGDMVYQVFDLEYDPRILEAKVIKIEISETIRCYTKLTRLCMYNYGCVKNEDFGETVFLTKPEAEAKLKELKRNLKS